MTIPGPVLVLWNYGHWCNMNCLHCYSRPDARASDADMTQEQAHAIAEQLVDAKVMHVHFGGGEPLGRVDFLPVATRLAQTEISVTLSTNGSLLTEEIADALAAIPISAVAFSIHGSDEGSHDAFNRFQGAWIRLAEAIQRVVRRGIRVKLVMTLTRQTAPHASTLVRLAAKWGVGMVQFQTFKNYGNASANYLSLNLSRGAWVEAFRSIQLATQEPDVKTSGLRVDLGLDGDPVLAREIGLPSAQEECECGIHSLTIKPNGDVVACSFVPEILGNVHKVPLLRIWRESPLLRHIRNGHGSPCGKGRTDMG